MKKKYYKHFKKEELSGVCYKCGIVYRQGTSKDPMARSHGICDECLNLPIPGKHIDTVIYDDVGI